jgi:hypothetical protein
MEEDPEIKFDAFSWIYPLLIALSSKRFSPNCCLPNIYYRIGKK